MNRPPDSRAQCPQEVAVWSQGRPRHPPPATTATTVTTKQYRYKGWTYQMVRRNYWTMVRISDGYTTDHNSHGGCKAFISLHGNAVNPDAHYEAFLSNPVIPVTAA